MPNSDFISISIFIFSYPDVKMPAYAKSRFYINFYGYFQLPRCNDASLCQIQILLKINIEIDKKSELGIGWHHYIWVTENKYRN
jgi:hypothetical protein